MLKPLSVALALLVSVLLPRVAHAQGSALMWDDPNPSGTVTDFLVTVNGVQVGTPVKPLQVYPFVAGTMYELGVTAIGTAGQASPEARLSYFAMPLPPPLPPPVTRTIFWNANPASDNVTNYTVTVNGAVAGTPTTTSLSFAFTQSATPYTIAVTATNAGGTSAPLTISYTEPLPTAPPAVPSGLGVK